MLLLPACRISFHTLHHSPAITMKPTTITLATAIAAITLVCLLMLPAHAAATTTTQGAPRKLRFAAGYATATAGHPARRLQQRLDWSISGPIYGKWCGLNHGGGGPPEDAVDACCMNHDNCYGARSFGDCQCDLDIVNCMSAVDTSTNNEANFIKVGAIQYFGSVYNDCCVQAAPAPSGGAPGYSYEYDG
jgi:hypothetical protein